MVTWEIYATCVHYFIMECELKDNGIVVKYIKVYFEAAEKWSELTYGGTTGKIRLHI